MLIDEYYNVEIIIAYSNCDGQGLL